MESLAVKYRPTKFEDVCSQEAIITILRKQLELKQLKNCYLFCGASGCGKTTIARIFANEINNYIGEPIEIDGASNNGVDNIKQIIANASERSIDGKYKIYIIDECHALTSQAWQAFLKCIEEPPEYTIFIFCTTDPQKIPPTILNRVMRFNFTRIPADKIKTRLENICLAEHFTNYVDGCNYITRLANGCMRDAISLLDKAASYNTEINQENTIVALGNFSYDLMLDLTSSLVHKEEQNVIGIINYIYNQGNDLKLFIEQYLNFILDITKYTIFKSIEITSFPSSMKNDLDASASITNATQYYKNLCNSILECKNMIKNDTNVKSTVTVCLLNLCR